LFSKPVTAFEIPLTIQRLGLKPLEDITLATMPRYAAA